MRKLRMLFFQVGNLMILGNALWLLTAMMLRYNKSVNRMPNPPLRSGFAPGYFKRYTHENHNYITMWPDMLYFIGP